MHNFLRHGVYPLTMNSRVRDRHGVAARRNTRCKKQRELLSLSSISSLFITFSQTSPTFIFASLCLLPITLIFLFAVPIRFLCAIHATVRGWYCFKCRPFVHRQSVCVHVSPHKKLKILFRNWCNVFEYVVRFWWRLTPFNPESQFSTSDRWISTRHPCARDIRSPRSKCCDSESILTGVMLKHCSDAVCILLLLEASASPTQTEFLP